MFGGGEIEHPMRLRIKCRINLDFQFFFLGWMLKVCLNDLEIWSSPQGMSWPVWPDCCVNGSYIYVSPVILILCFISTSTTAFFSLLYTSRLFRSFPFNLSYIYLHNTSVRECSLSLYKPDRFKIHLSVFWMLSFIVLPQFTKRYWSKNMPTFFQICLNNIYSRFTWIDLLKNSPKVTNHFGLLLLQICCQGHSKLAQSGHTGCDWAVHSAKILMHDLMLLRSISHCQMWPRLYAELYYSSC